MSPSMREMECCLERALIVWVGGTRSAMSAQQVSQAFLSEHYLAPSSFSVHPYYHENFLVVFDSHSTKDRILQGDSINAERFHLLQQWSRLALATARPLQFRVELNVEGILIHAWSLATVSTILSPSCWIESFDESSTSHADPFAF